MSRIALLWAAIRNSLWFIPAVITTAAAALAFGLVEIDRQNLGGVSEWWFVFTAGAEGARGVLSTIAGSIITVTGVVFSITIVVLQLASSQFTPRVVRSFTEDRSNQIVLGVFIGTFTYSLLVLRTVRSEADDYSRFVPSLAVTGALVLAITSIGFLIYFINHVARSIQAEVILERVTRDAMEIVDHLFPEEVGEGAAEEPSIDEDTADARVIAAAVSGYLEAIDDDAVMAIAEQEDLVVRMKRPIGDFIVEGDPLLSVSPARAAADCEGKLLQAFRLGAERTRYQDVERGLIELTDIGVRALSPGINDPTTAIVCVHRLTQVFAALGQRAFPALERKGRDGKLRVVAVRRPFDTLVARTFAQIRLHADGHPLVLATIESSARRLISRLPAPRAAPFKRELAAVQAAARRQEEGTDAV